MCKTTGIQTGLSSSRRHLLAGGVAIAANATGLLPAFVHAQSAAKKQTGDANMTRLYLDAVQGYYEKMFEGQPSVATAAPFGAHQFDDELEDGSVASHANIVKGLRASLEELKKITPALLSLTDQYDLEALKGRINGDLLYEDTIKLWRLDPGIYPLIAKTAVDSITRWFGTGETEDARAALFASPQHEKLRADVVKRLQAIPALLMNGQTNITPESKPPKVFVDKVELPTNYFRVTLPLLFAKVTSEERIKFSAANEAVSEALEKYAKHLVTLKAVTGSPDFYALGPYLKTHFECYELFDVDLDRLLIDALALRYTHFKQYEAVAIRVSENIKASEFKAKKGEPDFVKKVDDWVKSHGHPKRDDLVQTAVKCRDLLKRFLKSKDLVTIPTAYLDLKGRRHQLSERDLICKIDDGGIDAGGIDAGGGDLLDSPPPLEDLFPPQATFPVGVPAKTVKDKELDDHLAGYETNSILITVAHEIWPGHFMQYLAALEQQQFQSLARLLAFTVPGNATTEGWAHYVEQMVVEQRLGQDPGLLAINGKAKQDEAEDYLRLGQLREALLRDGRLITALRMHHTKEYTTRDQAAEFFKTSCLQTQTIADNEANRSANDSTTMNYAFGKMMILKLRQDYKDKVKSKVGWLKEFHDRFLAAGSVPVRIIRRELMETRDDPASQMWSSTIRTDERFDDAKWFEHL